MVGTYLNRGIDGRVLQNSMTNTYYILKDSLLMSNITASVAINSLEETVVKPIVLSACKFIKSAIQLPPGMEDVYVDYTETRHTKEEGISLANTDRVVFTSTEVPIEDMLLVNSVNYNSGRYPLYLDEDISATLVTGTINHDVTIHATITSQSRALLKAWHNKYLAMLQGSSILKEFDVSISYPLSKEALVILDELNRVKNAALDTDTTLFTYLKETLATNHQFRVSMNRQSYTVEFPEHLTGLMLNVPDTLPEIAKDGDGYSVELEFNFRADIPSMLAFNYPIFVGGHSIKSAFIDSNTNFNATDGNITGNEPVYLRNLVGRQEEINADLRDYGYVFPCYDSYKVNLGYVDQTVALQCKLGYNPADPTLICNLNDFLSISTVKCHPDMATFLKANLETVLKPGRSLMSILLTKDDMILTPANFSLDLDLNLRANYEISKTGNYHIVLTVDKCIADIALRKFEEIKDYPDLFNRLILMNNPRMDPADLPEIYTFRGETTTEDEYGFITGGHCRLSEYKVLFSKLARASGKAPFTKELLVANSTMFLI